MAPADNPPFTKDTLSIAQRSELIIDMAFTTLEKPEMAALLQKVPYIQFGVVDPVTQKPTGEYQSAVNDDVTDVKKRAINADSIQHVRIDTGDGQGFRYFTRVNVADNAVKVSGPALDDTKLAKKVKDAEAIVASAKEALEKRAGDAEKKSLAAALKSAADARNERLKAAADRGRNNGFRASAWLETREDGTLLRRNGKPPVLRFAFPGLESAELGTAAGILLMGNLNPQVFAVPAFIDETLEKVQKKYGLQQEDITAHVTSASMGTSNGMAAMAALLIRGMHCDTQAACEPFSMRLAHEKINQDLKENGLLTQTIQGFPAKGMDAAKKTLLNPGMDSTLYHAYRTQETQPDGSIVMSTVAGLGWGEVGKNRNKTLAEKNDDGKNETRIDMTGYEEVTQDVVFRTLDRLHMAGSIMLQLVRENIKAVEKERGQNKASEHFPENPFDSGLPPLQKPSPAKGMPPRRQTTPSH